MERKGLRRLVLGALLATLLAGVASAQSITTTLDIPSEERLRMADLWNLTVVNQGTAAAALELIATVRDQAGKVALRARAVGPVLRAGEARRMRLRDLRALTITDVSSAMRSALARTGSLPDGEWTICVEAIASGGGSSTDCRDVRIGSALPPVLLAPYDNAEVTDRQVAWSWFMQPRTTSGREIRCNLVVVEVLPGQTPEEALRVNPVLIRKKDLKSAAWQADPAIRPFRSGGRYAWRIQAVTGDSAQVCASEIWSFTYRDPSEESSSPTGSDRSYRSGDREKPVDPSTIPDPPVDSVARRSPGPPPVVPPRTPPSRGGRSGGVIEDPRQSDPSTISHDSSSSDNPRDPIPSPDDEEIDPDVPPVTPADPTTSDMGVEEETETLDTPTTTDPSRRLDPRLGSEIGSLPVDDQATIGDTVPLRLSAITRLTAERTTRTGRLAETPTSFVRWELAPTLRVYGMPISLNLLLSTERKPTDNSTSVDRGALRFQRNIGDINVSLMQRVQRRLDGFLNDPFPSDTAVLLERLLDSLVTAVQDSGFPADTTGTGTSFFMREIGVDLATLQNLGIVQPTETALLDIPSLGFGVVAPGFSELLMQGVSISGGMAEYNPGSFYIGGAIGAMNRDGALLPPQSIEVDGSPSIDIDQLPAPRQMIYVGRLGVGRRNGTHLIASGLYAEDDAASEGIARLVEELGGTFRPQKNLVAGLSGRLQNDDLRLALDGEFNASLFVDGDEGPAIEGSEASAFFGERGRRAGSVTDLAWRGRLLWQPAAGSRLAVGGRYVGPGYNSVGTAGMRTDLFRVDASIDQLLLDRRIALQGEASHETSGGAVEGGTAGSIDRIALGGDLRLPRLPRLSLRYATTGQRRVIGEEGSMKEVQTIHRQGSVTISHDGRVGAAMLGMFASASYQDSRSDESAGEFSAVGLTATGRIGFGSVLGAALTYGLNTTTTGLDGVTISVPSLGATISASPFETMRVHGTMLARQLGDRRITTLGAGASIDLFGLGTLDIRYDRNIFSSDEKDEDLLRATITIGG